MEKNRSNPKAMTLLLIISIPLLGAALLAYMLSNPILKIFEPHAPNTPIAVSEDQLEKDVRYLAEDCFPRAYAHPQQLQKAASYIKSRLEGLGYAVEEQRFDAKGSPQRNLIARIGPSEGPSIVVGAHYDVHGEQPGADDNASAVAGLLSLAALLKENEDRLQLPIELVAYTLEEQPFFRSKLMGSYVHAASLKKSKRAVKGMICLEMIGYFSDAPYSQRFPIAALRTLYPSRGNFIAVVGQLGQGSFTRKVKGFMRAASPLPVVSINAPKSMRGIDLSDHRNYWKMGYQAVMITNTSFFRNDNYHQITDTPETLDYRRMAQVVQGVYWAVMGLQ